MPSTITPLRAAATTKANNRKIVTYPAMNSKTHQGAQAIVAISLLHPDVQPVVKRPLVTLTIQNINPTGTVYTNSSKGPQEVTMATGEDLKRALYKQPIYFPKKELLQASEVSVDASYYHYTLRNWDTKSAVEKVMMVASAIDHTQDGVSFTVNFGERRRETLQVDPREAFRKLRNELMPLLCWGPVMMTLERSRSGILHLHGLIKTNADPKLIKGLLWNLAGHSPNLAFRNLHQVHAERCHSAVCWSLYMTKDLLKMDAAEASKRIYMSHESTRLGREQLGVLRDAAFRKLGIEAEWRGRSRIRQAHKPSLRIPVWSARVDASTSPACSVIH